MLKGEIKRERFLEIQARYEGKQGPTLKDGQKVYRDYLRSGFRCEDLFAAEVR